MNTHYVPYNAGNVALCGEFVDVELHDNEPSCGGCRAAGARSQQGLEAHHAQVLAETEPPEPLIDYVRRKVGLLVDGTTNPLLESTGERDGVIGRMKRTDADGPDDSVTAVSAARRPSDPLPEPPEPSAGLTVVLDAESAVAEATALTEITDAATLARGEFLYTVLCDLEKAVHDEHDKSCALAHAAWLHETSTRAARLKPILEAKPLLGERVAARRQFLKDEEARVQREAEQLARKQQLEEANRAAAALKEEAERVKREAAAALAAQPCSAAAAGFIVETAEREVQQLVAQAAEVVEEARYAPTPALPARPSAVSRGSGVGDTKRWIAEFTDWKQMRADIGAGKYAEWDEAIQEVVLAKLNKLAPGLNKSLATKYPGAEARQKPSLAKR